MWSPGRKRSKRSPSESNCLNRGWRAPYPCDHNIVEEGPNEVHEVCDSLAVDEAELLDAEMRKLPDVKLAPHVDAPQVMESTRRG